MSNNITDAPLINRVAESGLITLNLEDYFPKENIASFDLKPHLFMELILKEKDFRETCKNFDWSQYQGKNLLVYCSADAIIPTWAYMLVVTHTAEFTKNIFQGTEEEFLKAHYFSVIKNLDPETFTGKRIVIKGCANKPVPAEAYLALTQKLLPHAQSIMYGEPCSTVPIFKKRMKDKI